MEFVISEQIGKILKLVPEQVGGIFKLVSEQVGRMQRFLSDQVVVMYHCIRAGRKDIPFVSEQVR